MRRILIDIARRLFTESPIGTANFAYKLLASPAFGAFICSTFSPTIYLHLERFHACISQIFEFMSEVNFFMQVHSRSSFLQLNCCVLFYYCRRAGRTVRKTQWKQQQMRRILLYMTSLIDKLHICNNLKCIMPGQRTE